MNYCDEKIPYTRIIEHKFFEPRESFESTIYTLEYSRECGVDDIPYYPVRLVEEAPALRIYAERAAAEQGVSFVGRLATFRYLDMDKAVSEALGTVRGFLSSLNHGLPVPPLTVDILGD